MVEITLKCDSKKCKNKETLHLYHGAQFSPIIGRGDFGLQIEFIMPCGWTRPDKNKPEIFCKKCSEKMNLKNDEGEYV